MQDIYDSLKNSNAFLYITITEFGIPVAIFVPLPLKYYDCKWMMFPKDKNIFIFFFPDSLTGDFNVYAADLK